MKYLNRITFFSLVVSVLIFSSCEDQLTKAPLDSPSTANFFTSQSELQVAINGAYSTLWWRQGAIPGVLDLDNGTDIGFLRGGGGNDNLKDVSEGTASADTDVFETTWDHFYESISKTNNILNNLDKAEDAPQEFLDRVEGQARFLRAYSYTFLSELYGGVPLLTTIPALEESDVERSSKEEVVNQIMTDLNIAADLLPVDWSGDDEGRITKGAALALKARVALYNEQYEMAASSAEEVMNLGIYELFPDYEGQFQFRGERSSGVILDAPYQIGVQTTNVPIRFGERMLGAWSTHVPSQEMIDSYQAIDGEPIDESEVYDPQQPFENRDPRLDASIVRPQTTFGGFVFETHPDSTQTWRLDADGNKVERVENQNVTNPFASFTGYVWRKYLAEEEFPNNRQSGTLNTILIRFAEVLLIYSEAKIELDQIDGSVLNALNRVRARGYGVDVTQTDQYPEITTTDQNELRKELRYERKIELAVEGFRLFDIRRWDIAEQVMNTILIGRPRTGYNTIPTPPEIDEINGYDVTYEANKSLYRNVVTRIFTTPRDLLWAIPQSEVDVNEKITQNPGYAAN